jgi:hypothetical protein
MPLSNLAIFCRSAPKPPETFENPCHFIRA